MNLKFLQNFLEKYPLLKTNRYYEFSRIIIFPFVIKLFSKFFKDNIEEKLIIMGSYGGIAYLDNTKYLYDFLKKHSDYKLVWLTRSRELLRRLRKKGINAIYTYDLRAIKLLRRAKFIFLTHGYVDIVPIDFSPKTTIVLAWHGTPIKTMNIGMEKSYIYNGWGDIFRLKLKNDEYLDYMITPSSNKREHQILSSAFKLSMKKIIDVGYPKLDFLYNKDEKDIKNLKIFYNIPENIKRIILYCPTYREDFTFRFPFTSSELIKLNNHLEKTNTMFLIKAHVFTKKLNFKDYKNIKVAPITSDILELYLITDILITDYSSTMLDFSLLDRPILLYAYDFEYFKNEIKMYYELEDIAAGPIFFKAEDLIEGIKNIDQINIDYQEKRRKIRDRFNKYTDGKNTERFLNFFNIKFS